MRTSCRPQVGVPPEVYGPSAASMLAVMEVDLETFEAFVADALDQIPEELGQYMDNVAVFVEDWPTPEQLAGRRGTLLGLYQGIDLTRRSSLNYGGAMPDRITVFRRRSAASLETKSSWSTLSPGPSSTK